MSTNIATTKHGDRTYNPLTDYFSPTNELVVALVAIFLPMYQKIIEKQNKISRYDFTNNIMVAGVRAYSLAHYLLADIPNESSVNDNAFLQEVRNYWESAASDADKLLNSKYKKASWIKNIVVQSLHVRQSILPASLGEKYTNSNSFRLAKKLLEKYGDNVDLINTEHYPQYISNKISQDLPSLIR